MTTRTRKALAAFVLCVSLSSPIFAGEMSTTVVGHPPPPPTHATADAEAQMAGEMSTTVVEAGNPALEMALTIIESVLSII